VIGTVLGEAVIGTVQAGYDALAPRFGEWMANGPDRTEEWLGVPMFFSGFDADTNRRLVREARFELLVDELIFMTEPENVESGWLWVLAQRPA
jgi:hypothetical protein